ncbi:MAG: sulfite exporter TauE/SafE family protein [Chitinophagia bacterium]|nr:sulfite exporter TauE/SafE family protein [Chitinophagia bacterium]
MRISAYAGMALFLFSFRDLFQPGIQQVISIGLGVLLLAAGIISFLPAMGTTISLPWAGFVKKQLAVFVGEAHMGKIAVSGFLNGLLPCGLVYVALSGSTQLHSPTQVIAYMYAFGAGTIPVLASIVFLRSKILLHMGGIRKLVPVVVFVFGCLFVVRGMNLGVPYLSPKVTAEKGCITHSCCHKK